MANVELTFEVIDKLSDDVKRMKKRISELEGELGKTGRGAKRATGEMQGLRDGFRKAATAIAGVTAAAFTAKKALDFAKEGAAVQRLEEAGDNLAASFDQDMGEIVRSIRTASGGTLSEMEAMAAANKALQLGVATTPEEFEKLTQSAIALGRAMGRNASQSIDDVVTGIGRMSPLILDNLGITTEGGRVYERYAESLGKSSDELSDAEKKQALLNAATKSAIPLLNEQGELAADNAASFEEFGAALKDETVDAMLDLADAIAPVAKFLADLLRANDDNRVGMNLLGREIRFANQEYVEFADGTRMTTEEVRNQQRSLEASSLRWQGLANAARTAETDMAGAREELSSPFNLDLSQPIEALQNFTTQSLAMPAIEERLREAMKEGGVSDAELEGVERLASAFGVELPENLQETIKNFNTLESAGLDPALDSATAVADEIQNRILKPTKELTAAQHEIVYNISVTGDPIPGGGGGGGTPITDTGDVQSLGDNQFGGSFTVGGVGGPDSQIVAFRASPGERVNISPEGQAGGGSPIINVTVNNQQDEDQFLNRLESMFRRQ